MAGGGGGGGRGSPSNACVTGRSCQFVATAKKLAAGCKRIAVVSLAGCVGGRERRSNRNNIHRTCVTLYLVVVSTQVLRQNNPLTNTSACPCYAGSGVVAATRAQQTPAEVPGSIRAAGGTTAVSSRRVAGERQNAERPRQSDQSLLAPPFQRYPPPAECRRQYATTA